MTARKCCCCGPRTRCIASTPRWRARKSAKSNTGRRGMDFPLRGTAGRHHARRRAPCSSPIPTIPPAPAFRCWASSGFCKRARKAAVLIDEAYYEFCGVTALPLIERSPNLFVSRTFSKVYGMAAMRLGCLFSHAANIALSAQGAIAVQRERPGGARRAGGGARTAPTSKTTSPKCWRRASCCAWVWKSSASPTCPARRISCWRIWASAPSKFATRCAGVASWCATAATKFPATCA